MIYKGVIERYSSFLPVSKKTPVITLLEGNTPLLRADNIKKYLGLKSQLYLKYEGLNPTGSFKDRGMTLAISKAVEAGARAVICASTGNTSASAAAYSARAGLKCFVLIPEGKIALGKLSQALIHGAKVLAIKGNFDEALKLVKEISEKENITLVNSLNPYRIEGQKTAAFEITDFLGRMPDYQFMPVGNAGNITAYWKGYKEYGKKKGERGESRAVGAGFSLRERENKPRTENHRLKLPKMFGFQAAGAAPIVLGHPVEKPETLATAIRIGNPASWKQAEQARDESGGNISTVTDTEIISAYKLLAAREGIFVEPASAASLAGLIKFSRLKKFDDGRNKIIVLILTGHGLKDPDCAIGSCAKLKKTGVDYGHIIKEINSAKKI